MNMSPRFHEKTEHAAKGKWRGILMSLGIPAESLTGKHAKCPLCTSKDNFRWDNLEGSGSYICTCGAGKGMGLAMAFTGQSFSEVAPQIDALLGNIKAEPSQPKREMTDQDRRELLRTTVAGTVPVQPGDLVDAYMTTRRLDQMVYPSALRFGAAMNDGEGGVRPCMVALVGVHGEKDDKGRQKYCSLHRTFLRSDGKAKAEMASPRKMMPGALPDGACVMLSEWTGSGAIGIAEGIETAMAASNRFDMPVWAAISASMLAKWIPPEGADEVAIFGDNDPKFGGQAAAFALAHRLSCKGIPCTVHIPTLPGTDWADVIAKPEAKA